MTMTTITPEERTRLRHEICLDVRGINKVMDALDAADAENAEIRAYWQKISMNMARDADTKNAKLKKALEAAEADLLQKTQQLETSTHTISTLRRDLELAKQGAALAVELDLELDAILVRFLEEVGGTRPFCPTYKSECDKHSYDCCLCWRAWAAREAAKGEA